MQIQTASLLAPPPERLIERERKILVNLLGQKVVGNQEGVKS